MLYSEVSHPKNKNGLNLCSVNVKTVMGACSFPCVDWLYIFLLPTTSWSLLLLAPPMMLYSEVSHPKNKDGLNLSSHNLGLTSSKAI
jgi:hypothetical protein